MKQPYIDIDLYNERSAALQVAAGVDPLKCLTIVEKGSLLGRRYKAEQYFTSIAIGEFLTPRRGEGRKHDQSMHFEVIRDLHPEVVTLLKHGALVGLEELRTGGPVGREYALNMVSHIDTITTIPGFKEVFVDKESTQKTSMGSIALEGLVYAYMQSCGDLIEQPGGYVLSLVSSQLLHVDAMHSASLAISN